MGDFHPIGGNRAIFTTLPFTDFLSQCSEQWPISPIGGNRAGFADEFSPNCQTICHPNPDTPQQKIAAKSRQIRHQIASDVPNLEGSVFAAVSFGAGGLGKANPPERTSQFCVCMSSAQCFDSFKRHVRASKAELNFPKLLYQALSFGSLRHKLLNLGNGRNHVSRVLFRRRELTEPH